MVHTVKTWNYGNYSSGNYGSSRAVQVGDLTLYFSYETVVAFSTPETGTVVSENIWGTTTGKHLNWINSDKKKRLPREKFEASLNDTLQKHGLTTSEGL